MRYDTMFFLYRGLRTGDLPSKYRRFLLCEAGGAFLAFEAARDLGVETDSWRFLLPLQPPEGERPHPTYLLEFAQMFCCPIDRPNGTPRGQPPPHQQLAWPLLQRKRAGRTAAAGGEGVTKDMETSRIMFSPRLPFETK